MIRRSLAWLMVLVGSSVAQDSAVAARVVPARSSDVAAEVGGVVRERPLPRQTEVKAGDIILRLDPTFQDLAVQGARAVLAKAQAELQWAELEWKRGRTLFESRTGTEADVERLFAHYEGARAAADLAAVQVREAEARRDRCDIRSPFAGVLVEIHPEVGEAVGPLTPVARIVTHQDLVVEAFLGPDHIHLRQLHEEVLVTLGLPGSQQVSGKISELGESAGSGRSFRVRITLTETPPALRAGFDAHIHFRQAR